MHAEVVLRGPFSADELAAQLAGQRVLPTLLVGTKNDVAGADVAVARLRTHAAAYAIVDVNFLDEANFERLKAGLVTVLGLVRVWVLDRPAPDVLRTPLILARASSIGDIVERLAPAQSAQAVVVRAWGPSAKYPGQPVGLEHVVEDDDLIHLQL